MKKRDAYGIAETILKTGLGWTVSVINMVDPGAGVLSMYGSGAYRQKAEARKAADNDWVVVYYEDITGVDTVRSFGTLAGWRLFSVIVTRDVVFDYPNPDYVKATALWYPARESVIFTGDWEDVHSMPAPVKPTESVVMEWIKKNEQ